MKPLLVYIHRYWRLFCTFTFTIFRMTLLYLTLNLPMVSSVSDITPTEWSYYTMITPSKTVNSDNDNNSSDSSSISK